MLITEKEQLKKYQAPFRLWQGVPGIEVTKKGRVFSCFYSGGIEEDLGKNFVALVYSDDGVAFGEPVAVAFEENARCFDGCVWIDPMDRLWLIWAKYTAFGNYGVYAAICDNPDAERLVWGEEFLIGYDVMMNKPTVLSTGEWLFPVSVWGEAIWETRMPERRTKQAEAGAFAYRTTDGGKTFERLGGMIHPDHCYDEHMFVECQDGTLALYSRIMHGIGVAYSYDRGKTWSQGIDSGLGGPNSRFHIRKLKSGRWLLVNHPENTNRNKLVAYLSEDEGKTWPYSLVVEDRDQVSYPDAVEAEDGFLYITYDRERGGGQKSMDAVYRHAREVLYAKVTEEDIMAGEVKNPKSKQMQVISRLGEYTGDENPFEHPVREQEIAEYLIQFEDSVAIETLFTRYRSWEKTLSGQTGEQADALLDGRTPDNRIEVFRRVLTLLSYEAIPERYPVVEKVQQVLLQQPDTEMDADMVADILGVSRHWLKFCFERETGISVETYQQTLRKTKLYIHE